MRGESINTEGPLLEPLTRREQQVLRLLAEGHTGPEIAEQFTVSLSAVKFHIQNVYSKLGANSKRQALSRAAELGLLGPSATPPLADPEPQPGPLPSLPLALTRFIGREKEIAEVSGLLSQARLVTLTGAGGSGKTRLALEAAGGLLDEYSGGVWLVELAPLTDAWLVPQSVATALGLREIPGRPVIDILLDTLRRKQLLLVLDNCEHLVQACAELAESLLRACARLTILATSREALNIAGETTFLVPTLASPTDHDLQSVETLGRYEAVRLFVDRAQAVRPGFQLASSNARAVGQVCRQLDGIPLAIELAAARMKVMGIDEIASGLANRFQLLRGGSRTALPRHQTLQALIDWSYDLLSEPERALLRRLAVFAGGWTLEAARAVGVGEAVDAEAVLDLLSQLVSKSLVNAQQEAGRPTRYTMLETIHEYALARLEAGGETGLARRQHALYYLSVAEAVVPEHTVPAETYVRTHAESDNLRAALAWSQTQSDTAGLELDLAWAIHRSNIYGDYAQYIPAAEHALARAADQTVDRRLLRGRLSLRLGFVWNQIGNYAEAENWLTQALDIFRERGERRLSADALGELGRLARNWGDLTTATRRLEESLALCQELADPDGIARALTSLGSVAGMQRDFPRATALVDQALVLFRSLGDRYMQGMSLGALGAIAYHQGDLDGAQRILEESQATFRSVVGNEFGMFGPEISLGNVALARGDAVLARTHFQSALDDPWMTPPVQAGCLVGLAGVAALNGQPERAARLWGAAENARLAVGLGPAWAARDLPQRLLAAVREQLGEAAFVAAWAEGARLTLEQAVAEALAEQDE